MVDGLNTAAGNKVSVSVNGAKTIWFGKNGTFTRNKDINTTSPLTLSIATQPTGQQCHIINDKLASGTTMDNIIIFCETAPLACNKTDAPASGSKDLSGNNISGISTIVTDTERGTQTWRQQANARINTHRKTSGTITVFDPSGTTRIPNAKVTFNLKRHHFIFGGIIQSKQWKGLQQPPGSTLTATEYSDLYQDTYEGFGFNKAGFQNALKYKLRSGFNSIAHEIITELRSKNMPIRGHALIWPGWSHMETTVDPLDAAAWGIPAVPLKDLTKNELKIYTNSSLKKYAQEFDVDEWDVANEIRDNQDVQDITGHWIEGYWYKLARNNVQNPGAKLYLNENRVISDPDTTIISDHVQTFASDVNSAKSKETATDKYLDGLGFQSRFGSMLPPATIYKRLQHFDSFNLPISATEFEMKDDLITSELQRAKMTERVMTIYFSKENVTDILAWTFFPHPQGANKRHIVEVDGSPNLRGKTWLYMVKKHWHTNKTTYFNNDAEVDFTGFKGTYEATISRPGFADEVVEFEWIDGSSGVNLNLSI